MAVCICCIAKFRIARWRFDNQVHAINRTGQPVPLAFGHHPYFNQQGASLRFNAASLLMNASDALPLDGIVPDGQFCFADGGMIAGREIDHCYADWDGRPLAVTIDDDMKAAVIYIPKYG